MWGDDEREGEESAILARTRREGAQEPAGRNFSNYVMEKGGWHSVCDLPVLKRIGKGKTAQKRANWR